MWILLIFGILLAFRAGRFFDIFVVAPTIGFAFGGFVYGVISLIIQDLLPLSLLGIFIAVTTVFVAFLNRE